MTSLTLHLPAGPVAYEDVGDGPVVVLVHGVLMDSSLWRHVVPQLARTCRVVTPTLPLGAHRTPMAHHADLSMAGQVHLLADFMDALDLRDVTLVLSDWGGPLFLTAEGRDERVGRLVVTPCEAFDNFPPGLPGRAAALGAATDVGMRAGLHLLRWGPARRTPMMLGWMVKRDVPADVVRAWTAPGLTDRRIRSDFTAYARGGWSKKHSVAATQALSRFHGRATVVWTPENKVMPIAHGQGLARLLGTTVVKVGDAYVLLSEDQPIFLAQCILQATGEAR